MFVGLIQRCEQIAMPTVTLSRALDVFDERFYALPNLIDALSAIIIEMTQVKIGGTKRLFDVRSSRSERNFSVLWNVSL